VLGWMLYGIGEHPSTRDWVFKGGTSLKKCFFETFRFSEDLDYTLKDNALFDVNLLLRVFTEIATLLTENVGIEFFPDRFKFKIIDKGNGRFSAQGKIHYNGPLRRARGVATVKLDLTSNEILVLTPVRRSVQHPYSDEPAQKIYANCYAFEEVVAEKIRALAQRIRPRDLYDVVHFFRNRGMIENPQLVYHVLIQKCAFKKMDVPTFEHIKRHEKLNELEPQWSHMLAHQLPSLPPMISGDVFQVDQVGYHMGERPELNKIQFAAANRVCITLQYSSKLRTVEPLSFRSNSRTGNKLFYGFEREAGHVKAYSISKIQSVVITNLPYSEKYPVEISPTGYISMPPIRRSESV